ncbi:redoxin domain-containing protein [Patulibacter defluvii]|uniref:redoxin domain-containing protein n=1 Tax=Patulibacter defluvii TaxID=3095358 RepID=UPI002A7586A2|nr:redoxin domain-containing protein [Patulibacter sp. DM4]
MRVTPEKIPAPAFPRPAQWINVGMLRLDQQRGRPVLIEFWDFCRPASVRDLAHLRAWHDRYAEDGLRVVGVHTPAFPCSTGYAAVEAACKRLDVRFPVLVDDDGRYMREVEAPGWPARYLFDGRSWLVDYHHGEGGFRDTETAILELLGRDDEPLAPLRPVDDDDAVLVVPTAEQAGPYAGPYTAGEVWAIVEPPADGPAVLIVDGERRTFDEPGAYLLIDHGTSTDGELDLVAEEGTTVHGVSFAPGTPPAGAQSSNGSGPTGD